MNEISPIFMDDVEFDRCLKKLRKIAKMKNPDAASGTEEEQYILLNELIDDFKEGKLKE